MPKVTQPCPDLPDIDPADIGLLQSLDTATLKALWVKHFGRPPPLRSRASLLIGCLAYRIQEQAFGGLALATRTKLKKLATDIGAGKKPALLFQSSIKPGTCLIRAWGGQTHEVQVIEEGFLYRDQRYSNLSEIARTITGSRRSGPLFFGIRRAALQETNHGR